MKKPNMCLLVVVVSILFISVVVIMSGRGIEGVYFAHPPQLNTSVDFRRDGTMFMASGNDGAWFSWNRDGTRVTAQATSGKYKGQVIGFEIKGKDLFLGNMRFVKRNP
jgi:hypothetical protein